MGDNYFGINANKIQVGETNGTANLYSSNSNRIKGEVDLVDSNNDNVISYVQSTNTIDFHNKPVVNFSGGGSGSGGDAFLAGGTGLVTPQQFTGFNRFDNDCQFADGVLFSDDGTTINGKIHATATALHLETNDPADTIAMKLNNGGGVTNTLELKEDPSASTQNALFIQQVKGSSTLDKVLTNSTQDLGVIVDAVEVSPNVFTASNTFSTSTITTGITNTGGLTNSNGMVNTGGMTSDVLTCQGLLSTQSINSTSSITSVGITNTSGISNTGGLTSDVMTCQGLLSTQSLNASQNITGNQVLSNGNITCGVGSNFIVGSAQIASGNLSDFSSILNTSATQQVKTGNLVVGQLSTSAGVLNFDTTGGANIQNNTGSNTLTTSTTNLTDSLNWRLGTSGDDTLKLRYDANGGGVGVPRYFLEMLDPSAAPGTYFQFSGNSGYDVATLIALLNNTSLTFNGTTTTTFDAGSNVLLNGTTTKTGFLGGADIFTYTQNLRATPAWVGMPYVGSPTIFVDIVGRFALEYYTETWGTNTKVFWRGATELRTGGAIAPQNIGSIPVAIRPTNPVIVSCQGQLLNDTCRVTFETNGNVVFNGSNNPNVAIINFSQIEYFIN